MGQCFWLLVITLKELTQHFADQACEGTFAVFFRAVFFVFFTEDIQSAAFRL